MRNFGVIPPITIEMLVESNSLLCFMAMLLLFPSFRLIATEFCIVLVVTCVLCVLLFWILCLIDYTKYDDDISNDEMRSEDFHWAGLNFSDILLHIVYNKKLCPRTRKFYLSEDIERQLKAVKTMKRNITDLRAYILKGYSPNILDLDTVEWLHDNLPIEMLMPFDEAWRSQKDSKLERNDNTVKHGDGELRKHIVSYALGSLDDNGMPDEHSINYVDSVEIEGTIDNWRLSKRISRVPEKHKVRIWTADEEEYTSMPDGPQGVQPWKQFADNQRIFRRIFCSFEKIIETPKIIEQLQPLNERKVLQEAVKQAQCRICYSYSSLMVVCFHCHRAVVCDGCSKQMELRSKVTSLACPNCRGAWSYIYGRNNGGTKPALLTSLLEPLTKYSEQLDIPN